MPVQVAGADAFAARAGELGVGDGDLVVTYDDYYGIFAARVAWAFRYYGAEARVLDGGWITWTRGGPPGKRRERGRARAAMFTARPRPRLRRTLAEVEAATRCGRDASSTRGPRHLFIGEHGVAQHRAHPGVALPALPGARRRRDRAVGRAGSGRDGSRATPGSTRTARRAS